jgi:SPP1 family predicted phage head-tail adaptor
MVILRLVIQPRLDRKLCLTERTLQRDAQGFAYETWADKNDLWAGCEKVTANEQSTALQTRGVQVVKFRVRYVECLADESALGNYRIGYDGRTYNILSAVEDLRYSRRAWMLLTVGFVEGQPTLAASDVPAAA